MAVAINGMTIAGFHQATLWVLRNNMRAKHFYEADQWRLDGAVRHEEIGDAQVTEVRYLRTLP
jgi:hypothetical protein